MALDVETEIVATLTDPDALMIYYQSGVDVSQFADEKMAEIYAFAIDYFLNYASMNGAPSREVIASKFPEIDSLIAGAAGAAPSYLAKVLKDKYCKFQLTDALRTGLVGVDGDSEARVKMLRDTLSVIIDNVTPRQQKIVYGDGESMDLYKRMANFKLSEIGAPYPFDEINVETGGIKPGELAVLVAPPGKGKTWLAVKTALEAARQGWNVYFASLELDPYDIGRRMELLWVNRDRTVVPVDQFLKGVDMPRYVQALDVARNEIGSLPGRLVIDQPPMPERSPSALVQNAKMNGCNFVIIDQLQFVKKNQKISSIYEQTGDCIYTMKNLISSPADNKKMPLLLLHQMTREGIKNAKDGMGTMQDIAHSSVIEQLADVIWALGCTEEEKNINVMKYATLKTRRYGDLGYKLRWELKYQAMIDLMRDDNGNPRTIR